MRVVLATSNAGKLREFAALGRSAGWDFELALDYVAPDETGTTYAENAAIKAETLWRRLAGSGTPACVLADDSGLEVFALDGRPGVLSARFVSAEATWAERRDALLAELRARPGTSRDARFVCALQYIDASGAAHVVEDTYDGSIAEAERGAAGFSYDPIFVDPETGRTFAELHEDEKNAKSHRARAFARLTSAIQSG